MAVLTGDVRAVLRGIVKKVKSDPRLSKEAGENPQIWISLNVIGEVIRTLPEKQRAALTGWMNGRTPAEMAREVGTSHNALLATLRSAFRTLRSGNRAEVIAEVLRDAREVVPNAEGYCTASEAARRKGVSRTAIWYAIDDGRLPAERIGRNLLIREKDLNNYTPRKRGEED